MFFKLLGGALVVASCSAIGFYIASSYDLRLQTLKKLQIAISMLETEINYSLSPLPEALNNTAKKSQTVISQLFKKTAENLTNGEGLTAGEAWEKALVGFEKVAFLRDSDLKILSAFGQYLGVTDREDQIKNIKLTKDLLKQQEMMALEDKKNNEKLCKYLGVLSGIMVFLLLY